MLRLLDDAFLVVLPHRPAQFVVVHRRPVLAATPQPGHSGGVLDLEDALDAVRPLDTCVVALGLI